MSIFPDFLKKQLQNRFNAQRNMSQTRGSFSDLINQIISRGEQASDQPRLSAADLFGEQITRLGDSARAGANATKQTISRALMAGGGDVTGSGAANLLGVDQQLARLIGQQGLQFEGLAQGENRFQTQRADSLVGMGLQGLQSLFGIDQARHRDQLQQEQARRQNRANIFGNILQAGSTIGGAAILACWVAEELYGADSNEFHSIRGMLIQHEKTAGELAEFMAAYRKDGRQWARHITQHPLDRAKAKALFDDLYELSKAA